MDLHELSPVGRRATGRRDGRRFEGFAKMGQDLPNRPWLRDERDQPNVATTTGALEWKLLPHPGHEFRPRNSRCVVRAGLCGRGTGSFRGITVAPMPAGRGLLPLADVPDRERSDGFSQPMIRGEHAVVAMPMLPRRRDEIGQPVQKLRRREFDDAIGPRPSWRLCAVAARSGLWLRGRLGRGSRRAARGRKGAGRSISASVRGSENSPARRGR